MVRRCIQYNIACGRCVRKTVDGGFLCISGKFESARNMKKYVKHVKYTLLNYVLKNMNLHKNPPTNDNVTNL